MVRALSWDGSDDPSRRYSNRVPALSFRAHQQEHAENCLVAITIFDRSPGDPPSAFGPDREQPARKEVVTAHRRLRSAKSKQTGSDLLRRIALLKMFSQLLMPRCRKTK